MEVSQIKASIEQEIDNLRDEMVQMSRRIHAHPELKFREHRAAEWLARWLEEHGFQVERGIAGLPTAFRGSRTGASPGPTVAFLAEYDALPSGHACGHNIVATASTAAAIALGKIIDGIPGKIVVLGTPGEEGGGGKVLMIERGAFDNIDAAMSVHPANYTRIAAKSLASAGIKFEIRGKSNSGCFLSDSGNLSGTGALVCQKIRALREHIRPDARIHCTLTRSQETGNAAAGTLVVQSTDDEYLAELIARVVGCCQEGAWKIGASFSFHAARPQYFAFRSNHTLEQAFAKNLSSLNVDFDPGVNNGRPAGSTDMGNLSLVVPSIHPHLAIADKMVRAHSSQFMAAAVSERGHLGLINSAKALATTALDLMLNPSLLSQVKKEFAGN